MPVDPTEAHRKRDGRLRAKMLLALYESRNSPTGRVAARFLKDLVGGLVTDGGGFEDDAHALSLMRDLKLEGLATEKQKTMRVGQRFGLDFCEFGITAEGVRLHLQTVEKSKLVDDDRVEPEA